MDKLSLPVQAAEAMHFEEKILDNGLCLRVLPMPEYSAAHVIYATGFGAVDRTYMADGALQQLPAGIAHFLEHKMFENEDGVDAFNLFAETGALANAYTGFERTSYVFTATDEIDKNLDILLSFVSKPHFTDASVAKEMGIIGQEIKMYQDNADTRAYFALLACLHKEHPIRDDIVGTVDSIAAITPDMLYACGRLFYSPANMVLCAAGNITMRQLEDAVARCGMPCEKINVPKSIFPQEAREVAVAQSSFTMPVAMPLFALGFKEAVPDMNADKELACHMLAELLCGETSLLYRRLYDDGLVQPGFGAEFSCYGGAQQFVFSGESDDPEQVKKEILAEIARMRREGIPQEQFDICKKMMYGDAIAELENVERVAYALCASYFKKRTPAEELAAVARLEAVDVKKALDQTLNEAYSAFVTVYPQ